MGAQSTIRSRHPRSLGPFSLRNRQSRKPNPGFSIVWTTHAAILSTAGFIGKYIEVKFIWRQSPCIGLDVVGRPAPLQVVRRPAARASRRKHRPRSVQDGVGEDVSLSQAGGPRKAGLGAQASGAGGGARGPPGHLMGLSMGSFPALYMAVATSPGGTSTHMLGRSPSPQPGGQIAMPWGRTGEGAEQIGTTYCSLPGPGESPGTGQKRSNTSGPGLRMSLTPRG